LPKPYKFCSNFDQIFAQKNFLGYTTVSLAPRSLGDIVVTYFLEVLSSKVIASKSICKTTNYLNHATSDSILTVTKLDNRKGCCCIIAIYYFDTVVRTKSAKIYLFFLNFVLCSPCKSHVPPGCAFGYCVANLWF